MLDCEYMTVTNETMIFIKKMLSNQRLCVLGHTCFVLNSEQMASSGLKSVSTLKFRKKTIDISVLWQLKRLRCISLQ